MLRPTSSLALLSSLGSYAFLSSQFFLGVTSSLPYEATYLRFAALGDSWTSGINYGPPGSPLEFDGADDEVCRCRRVNEAYAPQLLCDSSNNRSWSDGRMPELDFQACHGAVFEDVPDQVSRLNQSVAPAFAVLTIGGNPGGFFDIVMACMVQSEPWRDYGPAYPDPGGECARTMAEARTRVGSGWFRQGLVDSFYAVLDEPRIKLDPRFRLYVVSYAGLFNHDDDACDGDSFGLWPWKKPTLTKRLRRDVNLIIDEGRDLLDRLINHELRDERIVYMDVNDVFNGHRFCESTPERSPGSQRANAWLYTIEWPACFPFEAEDLQNSNGTEIEGLLGPESVERCRHCGDLWQLGEIQRPFHPKAEGHAAIKERLKRAIEEQKHPKLLGLPREIGSWVVGLIVYVCVVVLIVLFAFATHRLNPPKRIRLP